MSSEQWLGELTQSLKNGFLADSLVLEVARVTRDNRISEEQKVLFQKAREILLNAKKGYGWLEDPQLSENSSIFADSFGQAVEALRIPVTSESFTQFLDSLLRTATTLSHGRIPPQEQLTQMRSFFFNAGRFQLDRTEQLLEGEKERTTDKWSVLTR